VLNYTTSINKDSIDTCEGARYSGYISSDMVMTPCSFDQGFTYGVSLRDQTLDDAWHSEQFEAFRSHFKSSCSGCGDRLNCLGGCPLMPSNVLCKRGEKSNAV
jgi:radical SAM protein with 4Fe4S-binding SPASM domain